MPYSVRSPQYSFRRCVDHHNAVFTDVWVVDVTLSSPLFRIRRGCIEEHIHFLGHYPVHATYFQNELENEILASIIVVWLFLLCGL